MRKVTLPRIDWDGVHGIGVSIPVRVDWPELQLTPDQILANAAALAAGEPDPYPDPSTFVVFVPAGPDKP